MNNQNQKGFVSIIVASTIMVILALITIGFTRIVQREQRQALDRQLSRQALYAAESGINDTFTYLLNTPAAPEQKPTCDVAGVTWLEEVVDAASGIEYTCVLYDKNPTKIITTPSVGNSKIMQLETSSGNPFTTIRVAWGNADLTNNSIVAPPLPSCDSAGLFPGSRTDTISILKFDLTNNSSYGRTSLINSSDYMYLVPCNGGSAGVTTYTYNPGQKGNIVYVSCAGGSGTTPCALTISGLTSRIYLARYKPIYTTASVDIEGQEISGGVPVPAKFAGQYNIDVTAKANDVVRRLRASLPISQISDGVPEATIQAFSGVCKLLTINPTAGTVGDGC